MQPLIAGINEVQELLKNHDAIAGVKTDTLHRILTNYLSLYLPEVEECRHSSRSDWFLALLELFRSHCDVLDRRPGRPKQHSDRHDPDGAGRDAALADDKPKPGRIMIDTMHLKAHRTAASPLKRDCSRRIGRTKGRLNSKLHTASDENPCPHSEGQISDRKRASARRASARQGPDRRSRLRQYPAS